MKKIFLALGIILLTINSFAQWNALPNAIGPYTGPNGCFISLTIPNIIQPVSNGKIIYTTDCQKTASSGGEVFVQLTTNDMLSMQVKYNASGVGCCPLYNLNSFNDSTLSYIQSQSGISIVKFTTNNFSTISSLNTYSFPAGKGTCITSNYVYSIFQSSSSDSMRTFRSTRTGIALPKKVNFLYNVYADKLQFVNDSLGFVLANFKSNNSKITLLKTVNYGNTWVPTLIDSVNSITDYHVLNSGLIYAVKQNGNVQKSTNFGSTWISVGAAPGGNYYSIRFANDTLGFIGGASGALFKTINSGLTWNSEISNCTQQINRIFTFGNIGYFTDITKKVFKNQAITTSVLLNSAELDSLVVYPNPTNNKIFVEFSQKKFIIEIYNTIGELVLSSIGNDGKGEVELSQLQTGIYLVKINNIFRKITKY